MPKPIPATSYPLLISLINETYFDKVEQISAAEVDDGGDIVCVALDGRKKLAVKVEDDDINIKLMGGAVAVNAVKFAAPTKKKTCSKGISCGASCISATKVCKVKTTPSQKMQKQQIVQEAGGALVAPAGKLASVGTKPDAESKGAKGDRKKSINDRIDEKYASANPSDEDVANWVKERINAHFEPTPENIAQRSVAEARRNSRLDEIGRTDIEEGKFSKRVRDRDSYAKARVAREDWGRKNDSERVNARTDPEMWFRAVRSEGRLSDAELSKVQGQVAKGSAAAQKKLAKHNKAVAAEPAERARAQELAAKNAKDQGQSKGERLKHHREEFDKIEAAQKQRMEKDWGPIQAGRKSALNDAKSEALAGEIPRRENPAKRGTYQPISDGDIKEHLTELAKKRDTQMFSGETKAELRKQYRDLAAKYHPDNQATGDEREFRRVTDAYNRKLTEFD
jgi:DnaJ domain